MLLKPGLGVRWNRFWRGLGHSLESLGRLWDAFGWFLLLLGDPWPALGTFLGALDHLLGDLGRLLGGFGVPGTSRALILEGLGTCRAGF